MAVLPLQGIRVLDLTAVWSGPYCTRLLADYGAEVIKVESLRRTDVRGPLIPSPSAGIYPDGIGAYPRRDMGKQPYNRYCGIHEHNRNKMGITLDLTEAEGVEIFKELVKISDVVAENFTSRVMRQLGLDYPVLSTINPRLVMISMSGYGATGPYKDYAAYGTNLEPMAGHSSIMGYEGGPPFKSGEAMGDPIAGITGANAVLMAVWQRFRTGKGQHIDLSQWEALIGVIGEAVLDFTMNRRLWPRRGNRDSTMAPHGCYCCKGEDDWVAITIRNDDDWRRFGEAIGNPPWTKDARFADQSGRYEHQDEIDQMIGRWTAGREHRDVMQRLQATGVPAGAVLSCRDEVEDPHLKERDFWVQMTVPEETEPSNFPGFPWQLSKTPPQIRYRGPGVGEHNEYVLGELLGLSEEKLAQLAEAKIIGKDPTSLLYG